MHVFPRLTSNAYFTALDAAFVFPLARRLVHVFPRLACMFPYVGRRAEHVLRVFLRCAVVAFFSSFDYGN